MTTQSCIYCGEPSGSKGEGDHVIPCAFGEFFEDIRFRSICRKCNSEIGQCEESLIRCGPESILKLFTNLNSKRNRKRGSKRSVVGAKGAPSPISRVDLGDHMALVRRDLDDPRDVYPIDQLVVRGIEGEDHSIRLYRGMTSESVRKKVVDLVGDQFTKAWWHGDDEEWVKELVEQSLPEHKIEELPPLLPAEHKFEGEMTFAFTKDYFRAIAKIGLHYYLTRNKRGLTGHEMCFKPIRDFIRMGKGSREDFFDLPRPKLNSTMGIYVAGGQMRPKESGHLVAAIEDRVAIYVHIHLFVGPIAVLKPHIIKLADYVVKESGGFAHSFRYEAVDGYPRFAGEIFPEKLIKGQAPKTGLNSSFPHRRRSN